MNAGNFFTLRVLLIVGISSSSLETTAGAHPAGNFAPSQRLAKLDGLLAERVATVESWETKALWLLALTITIGVLGVIAALLQSQHRKAWCKWATVAAGALVGFLVVITNNVFDADHRTYRALAHRGRVQLTEIELARARAGPQMSENDVLVIFDGICDRIRAFDALVEELYSGRSKPVTAIAAGLVATAEAAPSPDEPAWAKRLPPDLTALLFVGVGISPSLRSAKERSLANARDQAMFHLVSEIRDVSPEAAREVAAHAGIRDSTFWYDISSRAYHYYTLLSLDRRAAMRDLQLFFIRTDQDLKPTTLEALTRTGPPTTELSRRQRDRQLTQIEFARALLSQPQYDTFLTATEQLLKGNASQAAQLLVGLTEAKPEYYPAWLHLGQALAAAGRPEEAARAFAEASRREKESSVHDPSVHTAHGRFLIDQNRLHEGEEEIKAALRIDGQDPAARYWLAHVAGARP